MSFSNGVYTVLYIKNDSEYFPIGCLTSNGFSEESEMIDTTTRDNAGWRTSRPTNQSFNISFDGLVTKEMFIPNTFTYQDIVQLKRNRTLIDWRIDDNEGNIDDGKGYITSLSNSASIDENITFSGNIVGYGIPAERMLNTIYDAYALRVTTDSGTVASESCQKQFIQSLL